MNYKLKLGEKLKEALTAVLPIIGIVLVLCFSTFRLRLFYLYFTELYFFWHILSRTFYQECGVTVNFVTLARGTAASEILDTFGLESHEKMLITSIVTRDVWRQIKQGLQPKMNIDVPGTGIAFIIPLSSIGGKRQLEFLTEHQNFVKGEESTLKDTKYELLIVIANQGYTDLIMDASIKTRTERLSYPEYRSVRVFYLLFSYYILLICKHHSIVCKLSATGLFKFRKKIRNF